MRVFLLFVLAFFYINVSATVHADFTANRFFGCPPLLCTFSSTSTTTTGSPINYRWEFNNGNGAQAMANPSAAFNTTGVYNVKLIVSAYNNASHSMEKDSIVKQVTVWRVPQANFQAADTNICYGDTLFLNSNVTLGDAPITDFAWGFGNGVASSLGNPSYVYTSTGFFDITLVIQDSNRCSVSITKPQYIQVVSNPSAAFSASPATSCNTSQLVSFTNNSSGNNLSYFWTLNTGVTSTADNPTHTYTSETFNVSLTATNPYGCASSVSHRVTVTDLSADFNVNKTHACTGEPLHFTNISNLVGSTLWDFGNGATDTHNDAYVTYTTPGVYTIQMITRFGNCSDTVIKPYYITIEQGSIPSFTASNPPTGCNDAVNINFTNTSTGGGTYTWNFGDGSVQSNDTSPSHSYITNGVFSVKLIVVDSNGCSSQLTTNIAINTFVPAPDFYSDTLACVGGQVKFTNASNANGYAIINGTYNFLWSFGDGTTSTLPNPTHTYSQTGFYTVSLSITNSLGCGDSITKAAYIHIDELATDFVVNQRFSPCPPFVALFGSTCNRVNVAYSWDFGDGQVDTAQNPTHIYFHPGIYTVSLKVQTPNGCVDVMTYPHLIEVQGPYGVFGATPSTGCAPLEASFVASISSNTQNMWCDLGDGTLVSDSLIFNHTYTVLGTFNPKFILVDHVGCTVPYDLPPITTHVPSLLNLTDTAICAGASVTVPNLGSDSYLWNASPDIICDTCAALTIIPSVTTDYIVHATNAFCTVSDTMHVFVDPYPVLFPSTVKVCKSTPVELSVGSAYKIEWTPALYLNDTNSLKAICTPLDSMVYDVTGYNSLGCSVNTQVTVQVLDKLHISAIGDVTTCAFDSFQLNSTVLDGPDAGIHYNWTPANYLSATDVADPTGSGLQTSTAFHVVVSAQTCASDTASVMVHINNLPDLNLSESVTTTPGAEVGLWANSTQDLNYVWSAADSLSCVDCRRTNLYPFQTQMVYVTGTNQFGCSSSDSVQIKVMACDPESVFMPNVFTPNGDGLNDELFLTSKALASLTYFRVFDEWGRMVFETKNMNDKWDGKVNGIPAAVNAFAYVLEGKCQNGGDVLKYGNITIVK